MAQLHSLNITDGLNGHIKATLDGRPFSISAYKVEGGDGQLPTATVVMPLASFNSEVEMVANVETAPILPEEES